MTKPHQLLFDLEQPPAYGRDDFLLMPSNAAALSAIDEWPNWPSYGMILIGPSGSGKTHLAHAWQEKSRCQIVNHAQLKADDLPNLCKEGALCIEDVSTTSFDETLLFHTLNFVKQSGTSLLLTSSSAPDSWVMALPDLISRLRALPVVQLMPPDDLLLRTVMVKLFLDRQIAVDESIISYMVLRMPRSLAAARQLVMLIDRRALLERAEVSRSFVGKIMAEAESLFAIENETPS